MSVVLSLIGKTKLSRVHEVSRAKVGTFAKRSTTTNISKPVLLPPIAGRVHTGLIVPGQNGVFES